MKKSASKKVAAGVILALAVFVLGACSGAAPESVSRGGIGSPDNGGKYLFNFSETSFVENTITYRHPNYITPKPKISIKEKDWPELVENKKHEEEFGLTYNETYTKFLNVNENCSPTEVVFKTNEKPVQKISLHWEYDSKQKAVDFYLTKGEPVEVIYYLDKTKQMEMTRLNSKDCKQDDSIETDVLNRYIIKEEIEDSHLTPKDFLDKIENRYWIFK